MIMTTTTNTTTPATMPPTMAAVCEGAPELLSFDEGGSVPLAGPPVEAGDALCPLLHKITISALRSSMNRMETNPELGLMEETFAAIPAAELSTSNAANWPQGRKLVGGGPSHLGEY